MNKKDYFTFEEIEERWGMSDRDIRRLIVSGKIIPSFFIAHPSHKVRFENIEESAWKPIGIEYEGDDEKRGLSKDRFFTRDFFYLVHPVVENAFNCYFLFFSKDRFHKKGLGEENQCYFLSTYLSNPYMDGITLDKVISDGVLMPDEVERYEEGGNFIENALSRSFGKWPWGGHSTKMLEALEAAAKKWWVNYDKTDITTAPTNKDVIEWLEEKHGLTRNQASSIASILRPEDLRTGPRT
jgi:hypothetical protein